MQNKPTLWIVTELFYPDEVSTAYILTEIAEALTEKYQVKVICGSPNMENRVTTKRLDPSITLYRCGKSTTSGRHLVARLWKMFVLTVGIVWRLCTKVKRGERVLMVTNPAMLFLVVSLLTRLKKLRIDLLVHDVFPENAYASGMFFKSKSSWGYRLMAYLFRKSYESVDRLIVLGRDMEELMKAKLRTPKPMVIIENWGDTHQIEPQMPNWSLMEGIDLRDKLVLQYAGNIGRAQGLKELIECMQRSTNKRLHLALWGDGSLKPSLERYVAEQGIENVSFHGSYRREQQNEVLSACHLAIISLADNMYGVGVPSKSYNIMAAGKTILFIGNERSEIALTLKEECIGYVVPNDMEALVKFLNHLGEEDLLLPVMNQKAREVAERRFSKEVILNKFKQVV